MNLPVFDPRQADGARLLSNQRLLYKYYDAVSLMAGAILLVGVPFMFVRKWPAAILGLLLLGSAMGARHLAARGRLKLSIKLFGSVIWVLVGCLVFLGLPGIFSGMLASAALVIAVVDSRRSAMWYGTSYLAAWLVFVLAQTAGWQPPKFFPGSPLVQWFLSVFVFWITLLPVAALIQDLQHMLRLAKQESEKRAEAEQKYRLAAEEAQAAAVAKGYFLANMSHEIRTPMNAIHGMLHLLAKTGLSPQQKGYVGQAEMASQSLLALVNGVLDFSKIDAGKVELERVSFATEPFFRSLAVVGCTAVGAKPVEILLDLDPALPPVLVGDPTRLQQVMVNLLSNAVKFTPAGQVRFWVRATPLDPRHVELHVAVEDTGVGIAPDHLPVLFNAFTQAEASTTRRFGGTGLGLSICKRLLQAMGTDIQVDSELGRGSRFAFQVILGTEGASAATGASGPDTLKVGEVLLLANHLGLVEMVQRAVACQVVPAPDLESAWSTLQARLARRDVHPIGGEATQHTVVVDADLPDGMARQLVARLLEYAPNRPADKPRVVVLCKCGEQSHGGFPETTPYTPYGLLTKPFTVQTLREALVIPAPSGKGALVPLLRRLRGLRVLVVEDNPVNRQVAQELLAGEGAQVSTASNGQLAVDLLVESPQGFDVVLMDLQMPVMDGFEATATIRSQLELQDLPIVAMTANAFDSDRRACLDAGMNDHIGKPFDLNVLVTKLLKHAPSSGQSRTEAVEEPVVTPPAGEVSRLPTWEREATLRRLGGQATLLDRLIARFQVDLVTQLHELEVAVVANDLVTVKKVLHGIKGSSATVGADWLSKEAAQAEALCKQGVWPPMQTLQDAARHTLQALGPATEDGDHPHPSEPDRPEATGLSPAQTEGLGRLIKLAEANDMEVLEVMDAIVASAPAGSRPALGHLQNAVDALDFRQIKALSGALLEQQVTVQAS